MPSLKDISSISNASASEKLSSKITDKGFELGVGIISDIPLEFNLWIPNLNLHKEVDIKFIFEFLRNCQ